MLAFRIPKGDLELSPAGSLVWIDGAEYARQRIDVTLEFFLGEWFLDTRQGLTYFRDVLLKDPNSETVRSVFRRGITNTPGIVSVPNLDYSVDTRTRECTIEFEAVYQDGRTLPGVAEFII